MSLKSCQVELVETGAIQKITRLRQVQTDNKNDEQIFRAYFFFNTTFAWLSL